jgi:hypothetical protein
MAIAVEAERRLPASRLRELKHRHWRKPPGAMMTSGQSGTAAQIASIVRK